MLYDRNLKNYVFQYLVYLGVSTPDANNEDFIEKKTFEHLFTYQHQSINIQTSIILHGVHKDSGHSSKSKQ